ncbi:MAG TPA: hypothetical protein VFJ19_06055 [Nocardioidaceae bacterium]|nr:hypothetical protein [Nocardioidaceae bacterium]
MAEQGRRLPGRRQQRASRSGPPGTDPLSRLSARELVDLRAGTGQRIRLLRRATGDTARNAAGSIPRGSADGRDDSQQVRPQAVWALLRRHTQAIAELRRRRASRPDGPARPGRPAPEAAYWARP